MMECKRKRCFAHDEHGYEAVWCELAARVTVFLNDTAADGRGGTSWSTA